MHNSQHYFKVQVLLQLVSMVQWSAALPHHAILVTWVNFPDPAIITVYVCNTAHKSTTFSDWCLCVVLVKEAIRYFISARK